MAYDARTLAQRYVRLWITPTGNLGGIWMAGAAPAVDPDGRFYVTTGNGSFDADRGGVNLRHVAAADDTPPVGNQLLRSIQRACRIAARSRLRIHGRDAAARYSRAASAPGRDGRQTWLDCFSSSAITWAASIQSQTTDAPTARWQRWGRPDVQRLPRTSTAPSTKRLPANILAAERLDNGLLSQQPVSQSSEHLQTIRDRRRRSPRMVSRTASSGRLP